MYHAPSGSSPACDQPLYQTGQDGRVTSLESYYRRADYEIPVRSPTPTRLIGVAVSGFPKIDEDGMMSRSRQLAICVICSLCMVLALPIASSDHPISVVAHVDAIVRNELVAGAGMVYIQRIRSSSTGDIRIITTTNQTISFSCQSPTNYLLHTNINYNYNVCHRRPTFRAQGRARRGALRRRLGCCQGG